MGRNSGLCIGGPLAGQYLEAREPRMSVAVRADPGPLCYDKLCIEQEATAADRLTYLFHLLPFNEGEIGLWIPEGGSIFWALKEMAETYAMYEDLK